MGEGRGRCCTLLAEGGVQEASGRTEERQSLLNL